VDQHDIDLVDRPVEVECRLIVGDHPQIRIDGAPCGKSGRPEIGGQIARTPAIFRLEGADRDAGAPELAHHAAEKMRIAVVPVGARRMAKQGEPRHHATCRSAALRASAR